MYKTLIYSFFTLHFLSLQLFKSLYQILRYMAISKNLISIRAAQRLGVVRAVDDCCLWFTGYLKSSVLLLYRTCFCRIYY